MKKREKGTREKGTDLFSSAFRIYEGQLWHCSPCNRDSREEMKIFVENDIVCLREAVEAEVIGEGRALFAPKGSIGTVVLVYGNPGKPLAYEVEFFILEQDCYALATVDASLVSAA